MNVYSVYQIHVIEKLIEMVCLYGSEITIVTAEVGAVVAIAGMDAVAVVDVAVVRRFVYFLEILILNLKSLKVFM